MTFARLRWLAPAAALLLGIGVPTASGAVLHDQLGPGGEGMQVNSQNFEPSFDAYDDFGADDFVVPADQVWKVNRVEVRGNESGNQATSANVFLFADGDKIPGAQIFAQSDVPLGPGQTYPDLDLTVSPEILTAGRYWVSVQANLAFTGGNDWWWEDYAPQFGQPAAFKQPGDGFSDGCVTFATRYTGACYSGSDAVPDQAFRLDGDQAGSKLGIVRAKPKHRGKVKLTVNAPNVGDLVATSPRLKTVHVQVAAIGQVSFVMKPKKSTRRKLELKSRVKAKIKLALPDFQGKPIRGKGKTKLRR
jgi:hypothetical protein